MSEEQKASMQITGRLKVIAKTGGVKLEETGDKWINPTATAKGDILQRLNELKKHEGNLIILHLEDDTHYTAIEPKEEPQSQDTKEEKVQEDKDTSAVQNTGLEPDHIIKISGKDFVTFAGLLDVAHKKGLKSIETELVDKDWENVRFIFKAKVTLKNGSTAESYGDATQGNVARLVSAHLMRMAETRAIARALRWVTNIGMTSLEEVNGGDNGTETSD